MAERLEDRTLLSAVVSIYVAPDNPAVMHGDSYDGSLNAWGEEFIDDFNDPNFGMMNPLSASDLSYSVTSGNTGLLTLNGDGTYSFDAPLVEATFSYTIDVSYGGTTETAYLDIGVLNFAPTTNSLSEMVPHDVPTIVGNVDLLGFDIDGDQLSLVGPLEADHGDVELQSNGDLLYTPNAGYVGDDEIRFNLTDGITSSVAGTIDTTVYNMAPFADYDLGYETLDFVVLEVDALSGVLANDSDSDFVDANSLYVSWFAQPDHGSVVVNGDGSFLYTPDLDYFGSDEFEYKVSDGIDESLAYAQVDIGKVKILGATFSPFYIGEQINLSAQKIGGGAAELTDFSWELGDDAIKNYTHNIDEGVYTLFTADDLDDQFVHPHWISPGTRTVSVDVTAMLGNQTGTKTVSVEIEHIRPDVELAVSFSEVVHTGNFTKNENTPASIPDSWDGEDVVQLGHHEDGHDVEPGIEITFSKRDSDAEFAMASFAWTQLVTMNNSKVDAAGIPYTAVGTGLDTTVLSTFDDFSGEFELPKDAFRDSPGLILSESAIEYNIDMRFETLLMFTPQGGIPVAIFEVEWGWGFQASRDDNLEWQIDSTFTIPPVVGEVNYLPEWDELFLGFYWQITAT